VELVLGANQAAGLEKTKGQSSINSRASSGNDKPQQRNQTLPVEKDAGPGEKVIKDAKADATGSIPNDAMDVIPEVKPAEAKPVEFKTVESKIVESKIAELKPVEAAVENKSVEKAAVREAVPGAARPAAVPPVETKVSEQPKPKVMAAAVETARKAAPANEPQPVVAADAMEAAKAASAVEQKSETLAAEVKVESKSESKPETKPAVVKPVEASTAKAEPATSSTEAAMKPVEIAAVTPQVVNPIPEQVAPPRPKPRPETAPVAKPKRAAAPATKRQQKAKRATRSRSKDNAKASKASVAASGIGRGRSAATTNYRGLVSAHLARYKRHTHGSSGTATVAFQLNGGGKVTSSRLVRGSGVASIDQEALAMVRRASPFPAPPDGRAISFTVPLRFLVQ
jgi:protein TonB